MRKVIGLAIILIPFFAFCREVTLHFPSEGKFILFLKDGEENVYLLQGKDVVINVPEGELKVAVCDDQNRGAEKVLKKEENSLSFSESDFNLVYKVGVSVTDSKGTPIDYAIVTLTDSLGNKHSTLLREENKGSCFFYFLPQGKATLEAKRGSLRISQDLELTQKAEQIIFNLAFASLTLPPKEKVQVEEAKEKPEGKEIPKAGFNPFVSAFLSLLIIIIILFAVYIFLKKRGLDLIAMIKQQRVQAPLSEPAQPSPIPTSPDICPYCGQRKDPVTGACACTPTAGPARGVSTAISGQARLVGLEGALMGSVFLIEKKEVTIGRGEDRDLVVQDNAVSRRHCKIVLEEDGYYIIDEGSTNGTFVDGMKISREKLKSGDIIQIGETKIRFEV